MTSKEALEYICKTCDNKSCPWKHYEKSRCAFYGVIKQDLNRLEKLEKENQELRERYKHRAETSKDLCKAVNQSIFVAIKQHTRYYSMAKCSRLLTSSTF